MSRATVRHPVRRRIAMAVVLLIAVAAFLTTVEGTRRYQDGKADLATDPSFYALGSPAPAGKPGEIIRSEPIASAPFGTHAWRMIYHSRDLAGSDVPVSGVVIVPDGVAPAGGRVVVAWGHPTTGTAAHCAPSRGLDPFEYIEGVHELLAAGFAVVATDYPGLGLAVGSSYLLGVPEGNSVLDAVRAARHIPATHTSARVLLWGHSQGGQAVLFAAQRAPAYAPELTVEGVAAAAPAADLNALMRADIVNVSGVTIASYAVPAYTDAYAERYSRAAIEGILTLAGRDATPRMNELCLLSENAQLHAIADPLIGGYVRQDPATTEPWQTMLRENSAGGEPIRVPIFIAQGEADTLVIPSTTAQFVQRLCAQGENVSFRTLPGIGHGPAAYAALPEALPWLISVAEGRTPTGTCS